MPTLLYLRGMPCVGKETVSAILKRDLGWQRVWNHCFDPAYTELGDHRVPDLTDKWMESWAAHVMKSRADLMVVRPSRQTWGMEWIAKDARREGYTFVPVKLVASDEEILRRLASRKTDSPHRLTTVEAMEEYKAARREEPFAGEITIDTSALTPEQVAGRVRELLP